MWAFMAYFNNLFFKKNLWKIEKVIKKVKPSFHFPIKIFSEAFVSKNCLFVCFFFFSLPLSSPFPFLAFGQNFLAHSQVTIQPPHRPIKQITINL